MRSAPHGAGCERDDPASAAVEPGAAGRGRAGGVGDFQSGFEDVQAWRRRPISLMVRPVPCRRGPRRRPGRRSRTKAGWGWSCPDRGVEPGHELAGWSRGGVELVVALPEVCAEPDDGLHEFSDLAPPGVDVERCAEGGLEPVGLAQLFDRVGASAR